MWRDVGTRCVFFWFFTTAAVSQRVKDFEDLVRRVGVKSARIDDRNSRVYLAGSEYEIFFYDPATAMMASKSPAAEYRADTPVKLYTCVNCEFAAWTLDELFRFVETFPVVYDAAAFEGEHDRVFTTLYDHGVSETLDRMAGRVERFADVLFGLAEALGWPATTVDTSLLKALVSLTVKIGHMKTLGRRDEPSEEQLSGGVDGHVVRLVLESANDVQIFMAANCELPTYYDNKVFYGYSVSRSEELGRPDDRHRVDRLLDDLKPLGLESDGRNRCDTRRMLLERVMTNGRVLAGLPYVEIIVEYGDGVSVGHVLEKVRDAYDLEVVHWYQGLVLKAVVKLICHKTVAFFRERVAGDEVPDSVTDSFRTIVTRLRSLSPSSLSDTRTADAHDETAECFRLLASKKRFDADEAAELVATLGSHPVDRVGTIRLAYSDRDADEDAKASLKRLLDCSLEDLVLEIADEHAAREFECFMRYYVLLNVEFRSYYAPFEKDYKKITDLLINCEYNKRIPRDKNVAMYSNRLSIIRRVLHVDDRSHSVSVYHDDDVLTDSRGRLITDPNENPTPRLLLDGGCGFVETLIHNCFNIIIMVNNAADSTTRASKTAWTKAATDRTSEIRRTLLEVVEKYSNHRLYKIACHIIPFIDMYGNTLFDDSTSSFILRILSIFMAEINYYGLEYCRPPNYKFLTFNNLKPDVMGNYKFYDRIVEKYLQVIQSTKKIEFGDKREKFDFMSLNELFRTYKDNCEKYESYKNTITLEWKGQRVNIGEIYENISATVVRPFYFYAFFDVFFKFFIATIYYEIHEFRRVNDPKIARNDCEGFKMFVEKILSETQFPAAFLKLINHLKQILLSTHQQWCDDNNIEKLSIDDTERAIAEKLGEMGIFINFQNPKRYVPEKMEKTTEIKKSWFFSIFMKIICPAQITKTVNSYGELEKMLNEVLDSVKSIRKTLDGFFIHTI